MSSSDENADKRKKELYKQKVQRTLQMILRENEIDRFIDLLFNGIEYPSHSLYSPGSEFGRILLRYKFKGIFVWIPVYNENGGIRTYIYYPNLAMIKIKPKETAGQRAIERLQRQYEKT